MPSAFSQTVVDAGCLALAIHGNSTRAAEQLQAQGIQVDDSTLRRWRQAHRERILELRERHLPRIEKELADKALETAQNAFEATDEAVDAARTLIAEGNHREASNASTSARNLATVVGITTDKYRLLTDRPTQITEHRDADSLLTSLERLFVRNTAEATHDAQVVETPLLTQTSDHNAPAPVALLKSAF